MLSIGAIKDSGAAVSYYEKDDYYAANGGDPDSQGQWFGKGAESMGLQGAVDREVFRDILDGVLPDGTELGTMRAGEKVHRPGWDLTFSAPKSVSVAAEVGGDERIVEAHDQAVKEALSWIEKEAAAYKKRSFLDNRPVDHDSGNLVVALFQHDTSREQDPQLHTHSVVANVTRRPDGKWVSLSDKPLYEHKMTAGNVYRAALASNLKTLGYEIERTHYDGRFEISGVPEDVQNAFSRRRQDIEEALEKRGLEGPEAAQQAALMTRSAKEVIPRYELLPEWSQRAEKLGFDAKAFSDQARQKAGQTAAKPIDLQKIVAGAVSRLSETEAVFTRYDLVRWSLAGAMGQAKVADIEAAITKAEKNKLIKSTTLGQRSAYTTPGAIRREELVISSLQHGHGVVPAALTLHRAKEALQNSGLNAGQEKAVELIVTTTDRYVGVLGRSGTGKTHMLGKANELLRQAGYTTRGMAANSEAARLLQKDAGIESSTINSHLMQASKDLVALRSGNKAKADEIRATYSKQVWVVDEASQVDAGQQRRISHLATQLGSRVVLVGDTRQLASIGAGKPFDVMLKAGMQHTTMDEIRRQRDSVQLAAVNDVYAGNIEAALEKLAPNTREYSDKTARLNAIVSAWRAAGDKRSETYVLTAKNADKTYLSDMMRTVLRDEGKLKDETTSTQLFRVFGARADKQEAEIYKEGDMVRFGRAVSALNVERGEYLRVIGTEKDNNLVLLERKADGKTEQIKWNPRIVAGGAVNGIELWRPRESSIAVNERIQWNRNDKDLRLSNGQVLTVTAVDDKSMTVRRDDGTTQKIDTQKMTGQHWEHDLARTLYKAQGATTSNVLVNAEASQRELYSQKAFLVSISRQRDTITLFTDNTESFGNNVKNQLGEKTSARESETNSRLLAAAKYLQTLNDEIYVAATAPASQDSGGAAPKPEIRDDSGAGR